MTLETLVNADHEFHVPRFTVEIDGESYDETSRLFSDITVDRTIDGADHFSLSIATRFDFESGTFVDFDWEDFQLGSDVRIELGYGDIDEPMLEGTITEHATDFPAGGAPTITVSGYDRYHQLTHGVSQEQWTDTTDAGIVEEIAEEHNLASTVESTDIEFDTVENEKDSDAAFIEDKLAPRNAGPTGPYEIFARPGELVFRSPNDDDEPELTLTYGESLQSFSPQLTEADLPRAIEVRNWDPRSKRDVVGRAEHDGGEDTRTVQRAVFRQDQAQRIAEAMLHRATHDRIRGTGQTIGLPEIEIGEPIEISRVGRFSGTYYIEDVTHSIGSNGYTTDFTVRAATDGVTL